MTLCPEIEADAKRQSWKEVVCGYNNNRREEKEPTPTPSKAQEAIRLAKQRCVELFVDQHGMSYAAVQVEDHAEVLRLDSKRFRNWLAGVYYDYEGGKGLLNREDITTVLTYLESEAESGGNKRSLQLRVASDSHAIYYDLTNRRWEAVRIDMDGEGWSIEPSPALFVRYNNQQPQVNPDREYDRDIFERFFALTNVRSDEDRLLLKCYIISLFVPEIPKPILMLHGEQGSAKSTLMELIKDLVDPSSVKSLSFPRDINGLVQKLSHNYVAYFDNVSHIRDWISDELCKAVTGSGFSKRQLYTDDDDIIYNFKRCIGFNGINIGATKADILDRGLVIQLARIPRERRRKISEIRKEFETMRPKLLGYIFDTLSRTVKSQKERQVDLKELPRMADFAEVAEIISRSTGEREYAFLEAYNRNIGLQTTEAIEANPIAQCLVAFIQDRDGAEWTGTVSSLLEELEKVAAVLKINTRMEVWPKAPNILSRRLNEVTTNLRDVGIVVERRQDTSSNTRLVVIRKVSPVSPVSPESQNRTQKSGQKSGDTSGDTGSRKAVSPVVSPEKRLENHVQDDVSGDTGDTGDTLHTFQCPYCHKPFKTEEEVLGHGVLHHPGRPIAADLSASGGRMD